MVKKSQLLSWSVNNLLQPFLQSQMDRKWFGVRNLLNEEVVRFLPRTKEFKAEIKSMRQEFGVPSLKPKSDWVTIPNSNCEIEDSRWLTGHSNTFIDHWEKRIRQVVAKYRLPESLRSWVEFNILYGKQKSYPHYNVEGFSEIIRNPISAERIGLTTGEKNYLFSLAKSIIRNTKGRRKSALLKSYKILKDSVAKSKNRLRRLRTLNPALRALCMGTKETYLDMTTGPSGGYVTRKITSGDLATRIFNDETGRKASLVRKQKERLLKRHI